MYGYFPPHRDQPPTVGFGLLDGSKVFRMFTLQSFLNLVGLAWPTGMYRSFLCLDTVEARAGVDPFLGPRKEPAANISKIVFLAALQTHIIFSSMCGLRLFPKTQLLCVCRC